MTRGRSLAVALVVLVALVGGAGAVGTAAASTAQEDCSFPATVTDATGTEITLEGPPEEVVVLGASTAQTIWELEEQERVTGMPVGPSTAYLNGSDDRTHVLDGTSVQTETVVDLDPDLVIVPGGGFIAPEDVQSLRDAGLTVYVESGATSIQDVKDITRTTGRLLGACGAAEDTVTWMDERLAVVEDTVEGEDRPSVFYWLGDGFTAGAGTFQGDLLETAGGENAAANIGIEGWGTAEPEAVVEEDPEYILVSEGIELPQDHPVQETTAAQEDNVITVDSNDWNQPAPRMVLAVESITEQLHPEAYENATAPDGNESDDGAADGANETDGASESDGTGDSDDETADDGTADSGETGDSEEDSADDGGSDGTPGFGVSVAVAALLGAIFALRRP